MAIIVGEKACEFDKARYAAINRLQKEIAARSRLIDEVFKHTPEDCKDGKHVLLGAGDGGGPGRTFNCLLCAFPIVNWKL
jgi:hypothetical protein